MIDAAPRSPSADGICLVRPWDESRDGAFVRDSWRRSYASAQQASEAAIGAGAVQDAARAGMEWCLARSPLVRVAHAVDAPDAILGWACMEPRARVLHYVFVKAPYRGLGIARLLLDGWDLRFASHWTHALRRVTARRPLLASPAWLAVG